jgi:type VI protein secretion system component VasK
VASGFFVRTFIKYRPYLSVPLLTYKCILSILGVTYLIAFVTVRLKKPLTNRAVYLGIVICIWVFILYGGITRNARLAQLAHEIAPGGRYKYIPYILQDTPFENYKKWQSIKQNSKK